MSEADCLSPSSVFLKWGGHSTQGTPFFPLGLWSHWGGSSREGADWAPLSWHSSSILLPLTSLPTWAARTSVFQFTGLRSGICIHSFIHSVIYLLSSHSVGTLLQVLGIQNQTRHTGLLSCNLHSNGKERSQRSKQVNKQGNKWEVFMWW